MSGLTNNGFTLNHEGLNRLVPRDEYYPIMKEAMDRYPHYDGVDSEGESLLLYLFREEELEWLKEQYNSTSRQHGLPSIPEKLQDGPPSTEKAS